MTLQTLLMVWSIRLAMLLLALAVIARLGWVDRSESSSSTWRLVRWVWVTGCLLTTVHFIAVFGYVMHWSHEAAVNDTAEKTRQLIGVAFGGGVYFNYAFLLVWVGDAAWWCGWPDAYRQRWRLWDLLVIGYLWFISFNATVVFEDGVLRWLGLLATVAVAAAGCRASLARKRLR